MRIEFECVGPVSPETFRANAEHCRALGLPYVKRFRIGGSLAICGGGPSLLREWTKLRKYDAVWGINRTAAWLRQRGVNAAMFTVDPQYFPEMTEGVTRAVVADASHPQLFEDLKGGDVTVFPIEPWDQMDWHAKGGPTSATRAPLVATHWGFTKITYFGCESSYPPGKSHAYGYDDRDNDRRMVIKADGKEFLTEPEYMLQAEWLAKLITDFPDIFSEKSGGLLRAMIRDPNWEIAAVSGSVADMMDLRVRQPFQMRA